MSKIQSDRQEDIQSAGQIDRVTQRQNDRMTVWQIAGQLKSPLLFYSLRYFLYIMGFVQ